MYAAVSACTILLVLKFAGGCSEVWRALVSLISCIFRSLNMMYHYRVMYLVLCVIVSATSIDIFHGILSWALVCSVMSHRHIHALWTRGTGDVCMCYALACSLMSHWHIHALCTRDTRDVSMCYALACSVMSHWHICALCTCGTGDMSMCYALACSVMSHRHIHALCTRGTGDVSVCDALASSVMSHWHIHALCTRGTGDVSMCWALASSVMSHWHPCTVCTWHKRCVHVLSISFLCGVTLTHPQYAHGRSWMYSAWQKSLLNSYPSAFKSVLNFHIPFSLRSILISLQFFK
jgi:hypothetical protein